MRERLQQIVKPVTYEVWDEGQGKKVAAGLGFTHQLRQYCYTRGTVSRFHEGGFSVSYYDKLQNRNVNRDMSQTEATLFLNLLNDHRVAPQLDTQMQESLSAAQLHYEQQFNDSVEVFNRSTATVSKKIRRNRDWFAAVSTVSNRLPFILPVETQVSSEGLHQAEIANSQGKGIVLVWNHFSMREPIEVVRSVLTQSDVLRNAKVLNPIKEKHYNKKLRLLDRLLDIDFVVMDRTNMRDYLNQSINMLKHGGIVSLTPQATRQPSLYENEQLPAVMSLFVRATERLGFRGYGLLFVGAGIKGRNSYDQAEVSGYNPFTPYEITVGNYLPVEDLLKHPRVTNLRSIDEVVRAELATVTPAAYNTPPNLLTK